METYTYLNLIKNNFGTFEMVEIFFPFIMVKIQQNGIKCFSNLMLDSFMVMLWEKKDFDRFAVNAWFEFYHFMDRLARFHSCNEIN